MNIQFDDRPKRPEELNKKALHEKTAEHRLVRFFMKHGLEVPSDSKKWGAMCPDPNKAHFTFEKLYGLYPKLQPRIAFLALPKMVRNDLTLAFTRHRDCKLTKHAQRLSPGELDGLVFNFDGIKGGLIMHVMDLPSDVHGGSMYWKSEGGRRRYRNNLVAGTWISLR